METIERAYPNAERILKDPTYGIQAPEFAALYTKESVMDDMRKVKNAELKFAERRENDSEKTAKVFEAIMVTQGDVSSSDWFAGASILKTSRYDDYFNHTDLLAEWHTATNNPEVLALAVDVTFGQGQIERKLNHIRGDIDRENLGIIKYFKTRDKSFMGQRNNVPRVIIGSGRQTIADMATLWLNQEGDRLRDHGIQRALVDEIRLQLTSMREYAHQTGKKKAADAYDRSLSITQRIVDAKGSIQLGKMKEDPVYQEIMTKTKDIFGAR